MAMSTQPESSGPFAGPPRLRPLSPGSAAPPFALPSTQGRKVTLEELAGSPVVLVFYPGDFTPVCGDELVLFNELLPEIDAYSAKVLGISVDSVWSHIAFAHERRIRFALLSDFHPKGEVAQRYQVYRKDDGVTERALYVISGDGSVFWSYVSPMDVNPGVDGVLEALERLSIRQQPASAQAQEVQP